MNRRWLTVLSVICLALIVAATEPWWSGWGGGSHGSTAPSGFDAGGFTEQSTTGVTIQRAGSPTITLTRAGGGSSWSVNGKPAQSSVVRTFFSDLGRFHVGSLVSRNASNAAQFGVSGPGGATLVLTRSGSSVTFIVGNQALDPNSFYLRRQGSNDVYEATGGLRNDINQPVSAWQIAPPKPKPAAKKSGSPAA